MKRGITAAIILIAVFLLALASTKIITVKAENLVELTKEVYSGKQSIETLQTEWKKQMNWFSLFLAHSHLDPIETAIEELGYISEEEKEKNFAQLAAELGGIAEHISLSLYTVF